MSTLKEHVTCALCSEIYQEPQIMKCFHTFCLRCIQPLQQGTRIKCPQCKPYSSTNVNKIQPDTKTQALVEMYNHQYGRSALSLCDMCQITRVSVQSKCVTCDQYMCASCQNIHDAIPVCQQHIIEPISMVVKSIKDDLSGTAEKLIVEMLQLKKTSATITDKINDIYKNQQAQMYEIERYTSFIIKEAKKHKELIQQTILQINGKLIHSLQKSKHEFDKSQTEIAKRVACLNTLINCQELPILLRTSSTTKENLFQESEHILSELPCSALEIELPTSQEIIPVNPQCFQYCGLKNDEIIFNDFISKLESTGERVGKALQMKARFKAVICSGCGEYGHSISNCQITPNLHDDVDL